MAILCPHANHEIDEGAWGVRGNSIGVSDILRANQATRDRLAYTQAFLTAETDRGLSPHEFTLMLGKFSA